MTKQQNARGDGASDFLNENLKLVFKEFSDDEMPDEISDLLRVLKAQDESREAKK